MKNDEVGLGLDESLLGLNLKISPVNMEYFTAACNVALNVRPSI